VTTQPEPSPRLSGDYEQWTYGLGTAHAGLSVPLAQARYVAAIVRLPPGAQLADFGGGIDAAREVPGARIRRPLIWSGLTADPSAPSHWPVVLDFQEPDDHGRLDTRRIEHQLEKLSEPVRRAFAAAGHGGQPAFRLGAPMPPVTVPPVAAADEPPTAEALAAAPSAAPIRPVMMAVIDDGIPFAHRGLRDASGLRTRLEYCWLQSADSGPGAKVPFGRELTRQAIDALIADHGDDEDALYARAGVVMQADGRFATIGHLASHGAHVLDAAAGRRRQDQVDLDLLRIIAVQLPAAVTADTAGYRKDAFVLAALHYIFDRADRFAASHLGDAAAPLPLVVNLSYGYTGGPHDGTATLERAVAQLIAARQAQGKPTTLVMPAGNSFGGGLNGEIPPARLNDGSPFAVPWRLQPGDRTSNYLEIWLPRGQGATSFALSVLCPAGRPCQPGSAPLTFTSSADVADAELASYSEELRCGGEAIGHCVIAPYNRRWTRILVALAPTEPEDRALAGAAAGVWTVVLTRTGGNALNAPVGCRIQRDSVPFGYRPGARQSYFDDPSDGRFTDDGAPARIDNPPNSFVRRLGTLNGIATHAQVTVVSGFYGDTGRATEYGGAGRLRSAKSAAGPGDVQRSVISDDSTALRGVLAAGTRSGSIARLSGTSMAAPQVARAIALQHLTELPAPFQPAPLRHPAGTAELKERATRLG